MVHNDIINSFQTGKNLKKVREKHNMTIDNLSVVMKGVSIIHINKIENGEFIPTLEYIFDFCEYFCVSIDEVITSNL